MAKLPAFRAALRPVDGTEVAAEGDVVLTRGTSWVARAIRTMTRERNEAPTLVNHAAIVTEPRDTWGETVVVEAIGKGVVQRKLADGYDLSQPGVQVWRHRNPDIGKLAAIRARLQIGRKYGYLKLLAHAADWLILRGRFRVFRRIVRLDRWPICSYLVAEAYHEAANVLGIDVWPGFVAQEMTPDDIFDTVTVRKPWYCVRPRWSVTR